jgi:protein SCO1/2
MKHAPKNVRPRGTSRQLLYALLAFSLGLGGLSVLVYAFVPTRGDMSAPAFGSNYTMLASDGRALTSAEFSGRPYLVFFGYTHCPDYCPTTLFDISAVFKELGPDNKIAAIFVTVDPERDTPEVLKNYLGNFDPRIFGLTGDALKLEAIARAFRVYAKKVPSTGPGDYTVDHTGAVYLMDKRGKFVSVFDVQRPPQEAARELEAYF